MTLNTVQPRRVRRSEDEFHVGFFSPLSYLFSLVADFQIKRVVLANMSQIK